jgi:uncharacterized membrane protein (DUF2068 family)
VSIDTGLIRLNAADSMPLAQRRENMRQRSKGLVLIVAYKGFVALLTITVAIVLMLALRNHQALLSITQELTLEGKTGIIHWILEKLSGLQPHTLKFSGIAAAIYAALTIVEAIGLWYEHTWAHLLVILLVGISIPPEIYELIQGVSPLKIIVFLINILILMYLVRELPKLRKRHSAS